MDRRRSSTLRPLLVLLVPLVLFRMAPTAARQAGTAADGSHRNLFGVFSRPTSNFYGTPQLQMCSCSCGVANEARIVGGQETQEHEYPWMVRLSYFNRFYCGGTLINDRYVLTAAHCVVMRRESPLRLTTVRLGEHTLNTPIDCKENNGGCLPAPVDVDVEQTLVHPGYDSAKMHHDIALLRLVRRVDFGPDDFVRPVCLPVGAPNQHLRLDGTPLVVAGWGTTESGDGSQALLNVFVPAVSTERCRDAYKKLTAQTTIIPQQLCAGGEKGRDSCTGDSGGPLMREADVNGEGKMVQFGVVSYGPRSCGTAGVPGVYTRIAYYMQWILDNMRP